MKDGVKEALQDMLVYGTGAIIVNGEDVQYVSPGDIHIKSHRELSNDYEQVFTNTHDDQACYLLKTYNLQAYYANGKPRPAREVNNLSWYAKEFGYTTKELKEHWRCIENDNQ